MSDVNCSYSNSGGAVVVQVCSSGTAYCCQGSGTKYCSNTSCSNESGIDFKTLAFWAVLGGLLLIAMVTVTLVYIICYSRTPRCCFARNPVDDLFHEEEVTTVTSETHVPTNDNSAATVVWKTEKTLKVTRRQHSGSNLLAATTSSQPITICVTPRDVTPRDVTLRDVTPRDGSGEPLKYNEHALPGQSVGLLTPGPSKGHSPRSGRSQVTGIGAVS